MALQPIEFGDIITNNDLITTKCWSDGTSSLGNYEGNIFTSSVQINSNTYPYYLDIYNSNPDTDPNAEIQFSLIYGDKQGSGSVLYDPNIDGFSPSRTIYGQFRNLIYGDENAEFNYGGVTSDYFVAIVINRDRYRQSLMPGSFNIQLNGSPFTDDSNMISAPNYLDCGRVYQIVSGYSGSGSYNNYGLFLPDISTIVFNGDALPFAIDRSSNVNSENTLNFKSQIDTFSLLSQETVTSNYVFIRARNSEFNYSTNPSFISGSTGQVLYKEFADSPQTYITTVGLYNNNNDLLAIAKLGKPYAKNFTNEALVKINLNY